MVVNKKSVRHWKWSFLYYYNFFCFPFFLFQRTRPVAIHFISFRDCNVSKNKNSPPSQKKNKSLKILESNWSKFHVGKHARFRWTSFVVKVQRFDLCFFNVFFFWSLDVENGRQPSAAGLRLAARLRPALLAQKGTPRRQQTAAALRQPRSGASSSTFLPFYRVFLSFA